MILAMMMVPTVTLASVQTIQSLPNLYRENAASLGLSKGAVMRRVVIPQSLHGIITALAQQATNEDALRNAWGASLTLLLLVIIFAGIALVVRHSLRHLAHR